MKFSTLRKVLEDAEQLDELSPRLLNRYKKKATASASDERDYADYNKKQAGRADSKTVQNARLRSAQRATQQAKKREAGVAMAKKKLG